MRIAYLCGDFGIPTFGSKGASVHVRELCRALDAAGHEVLIVTPRAGRARPPGFDPTVVELSADLEDEAVCSLLADDPAAGPAAAREVRSLLYSASTRTQLVSVLRDFGADVVFERYALLATAGASAARELALPHVVEVNAPLSREQQEHRGLAFGHATREVERAVLGGTDHVVAVSTALADWLADVGVAPERVTVLANAVDHERFRVTAATRAAARLRLGIGDAPVVGFVGTLKPWHDVGGLIRAVGILVRAGLRLRLLVIGDGPERPRLEALARDEAIASVTTFTGAVPHEDVPACLAALDVAAATYDDIPGFYFSPLKLFEYLAAARPVVAADAGDIAHCVRDRETGLLYRPGDVRALAEAVLELLLDRELAAQLGAAGRAHVRAHHTWERNAEVVVGIAERAIRERTAVAAWV